MTTTALANLVYLANSQPMTDSLKLAEAFDLRHDNVLRKIKAILKETPAHFVKLNFEETPYLHPQNGETYQRYSMTRDGFMHIAFTFTGKKGSSFRIAVIEKFNKMENSLDRKFVPLTLTDLLHQTEERLRIESSRVEKTSFNN